MLLLCLLLFFLQMLVKRCSAVVYKHFCVLFHADYVMSACYAGDMCYLNVYQPFHRQSREAQSQASASSAALDSAQVEVTQLKALAAERQKRFVMLNGTFKKKEDGLRERADAAEQQVAQALRDSEAAQTKAANAVKV